nr:cysteine sulfinic acid decarboxylase-like [Parasteatoda tepidariorum]
MYGMSVGRFHLNASTKTKGMSHLPPSVAFISDQAHYSLEKGALFLGFGIENIIKVPSDSHCRMIPEELEKCVLKTKSEGAWGGVTIFSRTHRKLMDGLERVSFTNATLFKRNICFSLIPIMILVMIWVMRVFNVAEKLIV